MQAGTIWAGSDDGLVHVTRDGGKNWSNVTPPDGMMPEWIQINSIEASPSDPATAYVAATMYKWDDNKPYLYRTSDYGKTWKKITNGIPDTTFTRVIREDPNKRGLLYAGTETGMYVSFDNGDHWQSLQLNLPIVPITDLAIQKREKELVVATQGRSFWILDDLPVLHQLMDAGGLKAVAETQLFKPKESYRMPGGGGFRLDQPRLSGRNPANGVVVYYSLKAKPASMSISSFSIRRVNRFGSSRQECASRRRLPRRPRRRLRLRGRWFWRRRCCAAGADRSGTESVCLGHALSRRSAFSGDDSCGPAKHVVQNCRRARIK